MKSLGWVWTIAQHSLSVKAHAKGEEEESSRSVGRLLGALLIYTNLILKSSQKSTFAP